MCCAFRDADGGTVISWRSLRVFPDRAYGAFPIATVSARLLRSPSSRRELDPYDKEGPEPMSFFDAIGPDLIEYTLVLAALVLAALAGIEALSDRSGEQPSRPR